MPSDTRKLSFKKRGEFRLVLEPAQGGVVDQIEKQIGRQALFGGLQKRGGVGEAPGAHRDVDCGKKGGSAVVGIEIAWQIVAIKRLDQEDGLRLPQRYGCPQDCASGVPRAKVQLAIIVTLLAEDGG